jgi:hypothetical protein
MEAINPPVSKALVLVCEKCGKRLKSDDDNPSRALASRLKKLSKKRFGKGEVRALVTSCMDVCPDDQVSIAVTTFQGSPAGKGAAAGNGLPATRFFTVDVDDVDETSERILNEISPH